jgi:hypothetical protein
MFKSKVPIFPTVKKSQTKSKLVNFSSSEDREFMQEEKLIEEEVRKLVDHKLKDFSFEISPGWENYNCPEVEDIEGFI